MVDIEALVVGQLAVNCYLVADANGQAVLIDPGGEGALILQRIEERGLDVKYIVNTHAHFDHIGAVNEVATALEVPLLVHDIDRKVMADPHRNLSSLTTPLALGVVSKMRGLQGEETIDVGNLALKVIHTPGHTPGSITLQVEKSLFVGDLLFRGSIGRTDLPGGSETQIFESLRRILTFPDETTVYPGHGPRTDVGAERSSNPFLVNL